MGSPSVRARASCDLQKGRNVATMKTSFTFNGQDYDADLRAGVSIARVSSISQVDSVEDFDVGNLKMEAAPFKDADFVGDVSAGGSCNVDVLKINPHCSTTHTETLLHIVDRQTWPLENNSVCLLYTSDAADE